jgi:small subunit ribosomal protein S20
MRTAVKELRRTLEAGDADTSRSLLPFALALVDRTARLGAIHANAAARTKSRLTRAVNKLGS